MSGADGPSVALLGTGIMGAGMARSMLRAGLAVTAWNRTIDKARPLADDGARVVADPAEAVAGADVVCSMLFDADAVAEVMGKLLPDWPSSAVWVQTSTVGVPGAQRLAELADEHGVAQVDAPVLGTRQPAEQGKLIVLASGSSSLREPVQPVFDAIGSRTIWMGERRGDAQALKLVANSWVLSAVGATAQAVALARAFGLDPQLFLDAIGGGALDCDYVQLKAKTMLDGEFPAAFPVSGAVKDSALIASAMRDAGVSDALMDALRAAFAQAQDAGHGEEDMAAVLHSFTGS